MSRVTASRAININCSLDPPTPPTWAVFAYDYHVQYSTVLYHGQSSAPNSVPNNFTAWYGYNLLIQLNYTWKLELVIKSEQEILQCFIRRFIHFEKRFIALLTALSCVILMILKICF